MSVGARRKRRRPSPPAQQRPPGLVIDVRGDSGKGTVLRAVRLLLEDAGARVTIGVTRAPGLPPEETHLVAELDEPAIAELQDWMES